MKETYCLFLPADLDIVQQFIHQMFKTGAHFDRDYKVTPEGNFVRVSTETQDQFNVIRRNLASVLTND
jgi:hypothetical protein